MKYAEDLTYYTIEEVKEFIKKANGKINAVYLHWSAGRYGQIYSDYHISIDADGKLYLPSEDLTVYREHTYLRNYKSVAVSICGCYDATANSGYNCCFGSNPPTSEQIEVMSIIIALFVKYGGVSFSNILTHCEAAALDDYGPYSGDPETRWDLWYLKDYDGQMKPGGEVLRGKARYYLENSNI